jgi:hypothetical protein
MGLRSVGRLREKAAELAALVAVMAGVPVGGRAYAAGDANRPVCSVATESSPGFRALLPDCRAYELVSESNSDDTTNVVGSYGFPEGAHVYYKSYVTTPAVGAGNGLPERFLATRTSSGWVQRAISAPQGEGPSHIALAAQENADGVVFIRGFSEAFVSSPFRDPFEAPQLNQTTGMGVYRLSLGSGAVSLLSLPDSGVLTQATLEGSGAYAGFAETNDWGSFLVGGSADGGRAFFVTTAKLATAPGTPQDTHEASNEIFERAGGHTYLVGVLPDGGVPVCGAEVSQGGGTTVGTERFYSFGAIAPNGANVVFSSPGQNPFGAKEPCGEGGLFLRDVVDGTTVQLPGSVFGGRAGTGAGEEEKIFTLGGGIHEYHVDTGQTTEVGEGLLLTYTPNGARVYYLGPEEGIFVFEEGRPPVRIPGTQEGGYTLGGGAFVGGGEILEASTYGRTSNMPVSSQDGSDLLFIDTAKLTEYDNCPEVKGEKVCHHEAYVYDAKANRVTCISCNSVHRVAGRLAPELIGQAQLIDTFSMDGGELQYQNPSPPFISDDGSRAVFETTEALAPQDVNGTMDVYEWEREGAEGCSTESLRLKSLTESAAYSPVIEGCVYMLSSGLGKEVPNEEGFVAGTHLEGASENLQDVYMQTSESLLPGLDNAAKLYDARVDGGFPYTPSSHGCEAAQCELPAGESAMVGGSGTESFAGPGNARSGIAHRGKGSSVARKRRLARALRACRRQKGRRRRTRCERRAHRRFAAIVWLAGVVALLVQCLLWCRRRRTEARRGWGDGGGAVTGGGI